MTRRKFTDDQMIACLKYVAENLGRSPLTTEYADDYYGKPAHPSVTVSVSAIRRRYGTWDKALQAAGLDPIPDVDLMNIAKCLVASVALNGNCVPNTTQYDALYAQKAKGIFISRQTIINIFGNWRAALRFAGLEPSALCRRSRTVRPSTGGSASTPRTGINARTTLAALGPPQFRDERLLRLLLGLNSIEELLQLLADEGKLDVDESQVSELLAQLFAMKRLTVECVGQPQ